uniref:Secreted protein n=1 Tax=Achlya hypogyna TaxID=1202772 RepID=A0A0A7CNT3_ACHHY|nr:secreted protein [Achlya hypogyna]
MMWLKVLLFCAAAAARQPLDGGVEYPLRLDGDGSKPVSQVIEFAGASFITVHFTSVDLPEGASLTLAALDGSQTVEIPDARADLFSETIASDRVMLTYTAPTYTQTRDAVVFAVDKFVAGKPISKLESICGQDESKPTTCYAATEPAKVAASRTVARLVISGRKLCTGWLLGSEGHMMTNWHCIPDVTKATNVQVEFGAHCSTCDDPLNARPLKCTGTKVATDVELVVSSKRHDFALVKLKLKEGTNVTANGFLQLRPSGPVLNETVYIPQHAAGLPQRIAITTEDGKPGAITSLTGKSCDYADVLEQDFIEHRLDTQGGSSGSPIISTADNLVVAIHNCGSIDGCKSDSNGGVRIDNILNFLKAQNITIPKDAIGGEETPQPTTSPATATPSTAPTPTATPSPTSEIPTTEEPKSTTLIRTKQGKYLSEWNTGLYADVWRGNLNELFEIAEGHIKSVKNGECLDAYKDRYGRAHLHTYPCSAKNKNQRWIVADGKVRHGAHANLCLDVDPTDEDKKAQVWECFDANDNQLFDVVPL